MCATPEALLHCSLLTPSLRAAAQISPNNIVVRFSESVDGFPLPTGHSLNPELQAPQKPEGEAFLKDR